jgi:chaperonin cofactor prefoldin
MGNVALTTAVIICSENPVDRINRLKARHRKLSAQTARIRSKIDELTEEEASKLRRATELNVTSESPSS